MSALCPEENLVPTNFYQAKKKMRGLGLPVVTIDSCLKMCMIYWEENADLIQWKFCGKERYKRYKEGTSKKR